MDPNSNLTPNPNPNPTMSPDQTPNLAENPASILNLEQTGPNTVPSADLNPAAVVANAAMAGAAPVVTATELDLVSSAYPNPANPVNSPISLIPSIDESSPVSLTPSDNFQMDTIGAVSPLAGNAGLNVIPEPDYNPQSQLQSQTTPDFNDPNAENTLAAEEIKKQKIESDLAEEPIIAAAPVPGSIGSAKSYVDIQRAEAEKTAKMAAEQTKKFKISKKTIIIGAIAGVVLIGAIVMFVMMFSGNKKTTPIKPNTPVPSAKEPDLSTLSCKRNLVPEEYSSFGAVSGTQENIFYFKDDTLDGLVTNLSYTYANQALANQAHERFKRDYGDAKPVEKVYEEQSNEQKAVTTKTAEQMLKHYVSAKNFNVIHGMEIRSEDINTWLSSDNYSDKTYGATVDGKANENSNEPTRNLSFYNRLQNDIGYACSISKGY